MNIVFCHHFGQEGGLRQHLYKDLYIYPAEDSDKYTYCTLRLLVICTIPILWFSELQGGRFGPEVWQTHWVYGGNVIAVIIRLCWTEQDWEFSSSERGHFLCQFADPSLYTPPIILWWVKYCAPYRNTLLGRAVILGRRVWAVGITMGPNRRAIL